MALALRILALSVICTLALRSPATAGELLQGVVLDHDTDQPVYLATVHLVELGRYVTTDEDGRFSFENIERGTYTVEFSHIAYKAKTISFQCVGEDTHEFVVYLDPKSFEFSPVIISGTHTHSKLEDLQEYSRVLKGKELERDLSQTLASTLKHETGIAIRSMGPAPARPVIRGLGGDRVHISEDGQKTADLSASSPDHAVTIEPFSLERIEVLRGPKVLLKSSTTFGGVVNAVRHEIPTVREENIAGSIGAYGESANSGYLGLATLQVPVESFMVRGEISRKATENLQTPIGELENSQSENLNVSAAASHTGEYGYTGFAVRNYELDYGIPGGFVGAHPNGVDIEMRRTQYSGAFETKLGDGFFRNLEVRGARTFYRHKEFENADLIGAEFKIVDYAGFANISHKAQGASNGGTFGVSTQVRDYEVGGFVFQPKNTSTNLSLYAFESLNFGELNIEAAARYQFDRISPDEEELNSRIGHIREKIYNSWSASVSGLYSIADAVGFGASVSRSSRVPTIEELFSEGPHLAAYSYEVGNPELEGERGIGVEAFAYYKNTDLFIMLTAFRNDFDYFIVPRNTGEINYQTFLPVYATFGIPAILQGYEAQLDWNITKHFALSASYSYTKGTNEEDDIPLPQIAPQKLFATFGYTKGSLTCGATAELSDRQDRVDAFEEPTAGYSVFGAFAQYSFATNGYAHNVSLNVDNIFDREYRNHLSRVKAVLPEAGRSFRLSYKLYFEV